MVEVKETFFLKEEEHDSDYDCIIHLSVAENPHETLCCHKLICGECLNLIKKKEFKKCPYCNEKLHVSKAGVFIKRIIDRYPKICKECSYKTTIGDYENHIEKCWKKDDRIK